MLFYQSTAPINALIRIKNAQHKSEQSLQVSLPITYCLNMPNNNFFWPQDLDSFSFINTLGNNVSWRTASNFSKTIRYLVPILMPKAAVPAASIMEISSSNSVITLERIMPAYPSLPMRR